MFEVVEVGVLQFYELGMWDWGSVQLLDIIVGVDYYFFKQEVVGVGVVLVF